MKEENFTRKKSDSELMEEINNTLNHVNLVKEGEAKPAKDLNAKTDIGDGLRFNQGKLRYDLVHPRAHEDMVDVLTYGATKYSPYNWSKGFAWSSVIASLKRHLAAIEAGEDYDIGEGGSGKLHVANLACNAHFLNAFYYDFPQGDDRPKKILKLPKICLDIDEVCANFVKAYMDKYNVPTPHFWNFDRNMIKNFNEMKNNGTLDDFYLSIEPLFNPLTIPFEPHCYITSRPVDTKVTEKWLDLHGFPVAPVYTVPIVTSKIKVALESGAEIFVDDKFENFKEINNTKGLTCYLYDQPHNRRYDVGHLRIKTLNDLPWFK
jgi:hypothetical protein